MLVIDGHNLIPKIPGFSLSDLDDEEKLVNLLQAYARARRLKKIELFFDGAPPGHAGARSFGVIQAHFVQQGKPADEAIRQYLASLGRAARNVTVVSSDHWVQRSALELHAQVLSAEDFSQQLQDLPAKAPPNAAPHAEDSAGALSEWYDVFGLDVHQAETPIDLSARPRPRKSPKKPHSNQRPNHGFPSKKR